MERNVNFKTGGRAYYVPTLYAEGVPGKIVDVQYFAGRAEYVTIATRDGRIISDYAARFSKSKPTPYFVATTYHENYLNKSTGSVVALRELRVSYEVHQAGKMSFDDYMNELKKSGCFIPID